MKKILVLLMVMAIAMGSMFAAEGTGTWSGANVSEDATATLEVKLNLADYDGLYTIGFTGTDVSTETETIEPISSFDLELQNDEYVGTVYGYYAIKTVAAENLEFQMSAPANLTQVGGDKTIAWTVETDGVYEDKVTLETTAKTVDTLTTTAGTYVVDAFPITMTTVGFLEDPIAADEVYSAMLSLTIKTTD